MKLSWSHAVLYVKDQEKMLDFYTHTLGFSISDRGSPAENLPEIVFMSQDPEEHHQIALVQARTDEGPSNSVNHFAFRTESFDNVKALNGKLKAIDGINIMPLSHGNTLSIYFNDPEGNGIEVFWDTPWHIAQPQGKPWDTNLNEEEALSWIEETFGDDPSFVRSEQCDSTYANRR